MERKNMVLLTVIAVATLLVAVVGATFAYFTATITDQRDVGTGQGAANVTAADKPGSLIIEKSDHQFGSFNNTDIYPGHKELIELKITSEDTNTTDTYFNIVYDGTNTFTANSIEFKIYESTLPLTEAEDGIFECTKHSELQDGEATTAGAGNYKFYETCTLKSDLEKSGAQPIVTKPLSNSAGKTKTILNGDLPFVITGDATRKTIYYYVVVEYKDTTSNQNDDMKKSLSGTITVEMAASNNNAYKDTDENVIDE